MIVQYQPVIEISTGRVVRAEVLSRIPEGLDGIHDIGTFIPHAEGVGLIGEVTQSVLALASSEREGWDIPLPISFNISRLDLEDRSFFDRTMALFARHDVDPRAITFELNDGIQAIEEGAALEAMRRLRAAGLRFCVDGFGPTVSMFSHLELERIAVQEVKIDMLGDFGPTKRTTIESVVFMASNLAIDVVAKGIENAERLALATRLGFGFAQGYGIARPMDGAKLQRWLADREIVAVERLPSVVPSAPAPPAKRSFLGGLFGKTPRP